MYAHFTSYLLLDFTSIKYFAQQFLTLYLRLIIFIINFCFRIIIHLLAAIVLIKDFNLVTSIYLNFNQKRNSFYFDETIHFEVRLVNIILKANLFIFPFFIINFKIIILMYYYFLL